MKQDFLDALQKHINEFDLATVEAASRAMPVDVNKYAAIILGFILVLALYSIIRVMDMLVDDKKRDLS